MATLWSYRHERFLARVWVPQQEAQQLLDSSVRGRRRDDKNTRAEAVRLVQENLRNR